MGSRRRRWSAAEKATIVAETNAVGAKVTEVAARHGLNESVLFTWRRRAIEPKGGALPVPVERLLPAATTFVPVTICETAATADAMEAPPDAPRSPGLIEIALADASIRVTAGVDAATLVMVLAAVRGSV
jgi:transposase